RLVMRPGPARDRLTAGMFVPGPEDPGAGAVEAAFAAVIAAEGAEQKIRAARAQRDEAAGASDIENALAAGAITRAEAELAERARTLTRKAIMVDDFPMDLGPTEIYQTTEPVKAGARARVE